VKKRTIAALTALLLFLSSCGQQAVWKVPMEQQSGSASVEPAEENTESIAPERSMAQEPVSAENSAPTAEAQSAPAEKEQSAGQPAQSAEADEIPEQWDKDTTFQHTLCFTGDINLAEGQYTTAALDRDGLKSCVGKVLRREMRKADVLCVNNEFSYTTRGTPLEGKAFTFRANPSRTETMKKLGADVAVLANNHVFDYGEEGLSDTLDALKEADIAAIGAGRNLKEASAVHYEKLEGCTVAFVAATRVEWSAQTRAATKEDMGVFQTAYDTDLLYKQVKKAKKKADYVVVCMHWGMEGTAELEEYQTKVGKGLAKAGADLVVGDHPHQLQGVKWVKNTPIFYSLGNFWFNRREEYTMLLKVTLSGDKYGLRKVRTQVVPAWQADAKVKALTEEKEQRAMYDYLSSLPGSNIRINDKGIVKKKK
jgi:poly-gamma-glutamate synthesis protein (capsule biosynthesis protein)